MNTNYSYIANSKVMLILCSLPIIYALIQSGLFFRLAYKKCLEIGYTKDDIKKVVKASAIFSVVPSLPIIISYMLLMPALGKFFPWLRLSVIGSASYETMVANMAVTSLGYSGLGGSDLPIEVFGTILWVVTLGIMLSSLSVLILKRYDNKIQDMKQDKTSFGAQIGRIMFLAMMATFSAPYLVDFSNPVAIISILSSGLSVLLLDKLSEKLPKLKEFSFSLSMIIGMAAASGSTLLLGGI